MIKYILLICFVQLAFLNLNAQTNSPYTRFGVGELMPNSFANVSSAGGLSASFNSPYQLNFSNPASYGFLNKTTFNFAITATSLHIAKGDSAETFGNGQLSYLAYGLPLVKNKLGLSFGLMPYSQVNYNLLQLNDSTVGLGPNYNSYQGSGALYRFYLGTGVHIKNFAAGINAQYLFGNISYTDLQVFTGDSINAFNTRRLETKSIGDLIIDGGMQMNIPISKQIDNTFKYNLTFGITGGNKSNVNVSDRLLYDRFVYRSVTVNYTVPVYKDTIMLDTLSGVMTLPMHFDAGIRLVQEGRFFAGVNYSYSKWSEYNWLGETEPSAVDYHKLSFGGEYIPKNEDDDNLFRMIRYRAGFYTGQYYQQFNGVSLKETGLTLGAGFPFLYRTSYNTKVLSEISLSLDFGVRGTTDNNLIKESYFKGTVGFSLTDLWFVKRKFD